MRKSILLFCAIFLFFFIFPKITFGYDYLNLNITPQPCPCPADLISTRVYSASCAANLDEFKLNPTTRHYWVEDPDVTSQGKSDERARQFISWTLSNNAVDEHPSLKEIWNVSRNISYFFVIIIAAIIGFGIIIGQRTNFQLKIQVWPAIYKVGGAILFITFSAAIVLFFIQISEILMKFFSESLGSNKLFNIYFSTSGANDNYRSFIGCRDLNFRVQEGANAELILLKLTNITYYIMGSMLLLRKILLWFLLIVSPFLAVLFPFTLIRNIGWIWIGVFFQWLFYGPLFALFLGALAKIWQNGIPFTFNFSRAGTIDGYVYPTAINILYGGPSQVLDSHLKNGNYIDTFVEYIITLIMLWAVIFFPWWLLRIFRDYCCEGIMAMKNILMSMYDQTRNNQPPSPNQPSVSPISNIGTTIQTRKDTETHIITKLETIEEIKKTKTEDITRSLNLSATKLTDVARFETNKQTYENVKRNIDYLSNPTRAETPKDRQKYMNIRTELFSRAIKEDRQAKQILSSISSSKIEQLSRREEIINSIPSTQTTSSTNLVSSKNNLSQNVTTSVNTNVVNTISNNTNLVNNISQQSQTTSSQVQSVLNSYKQNINQAPTQIVQNITNETGLAKEKVVEILKKTSQVLKTNNSLVKEIALKENVKETDVNNIIQNQIPNIIEQRKNIENIVSIPPSISIEDYEEVKKMWQNQYEKGEVPVNENITSRSQWVDQDIVFITNTMNKLLSTDNKLKQEGLDDIGYILPIFLINNLKGDELIVYLKAKLEAAKTVQNQVEKEKEITEKLKAESVEEMVEVNKPKDTTAEKTMEMKNELTTPNENKTDEIK